VKEKEKDKERSSTWTGRSAHDIGAGRPWWSTFPPMPRSLSTARQMASKSTRRVFQTPALEAGQKYYYEIPRRSRFADGRTITPTRQVILNAGLSTAAAFADLAIVNRRRQRRTTRNSLVFEGTVSFPPRGPRMGRGPHFFCPLAA